MDLKQLYHTNFNEKKDFIRRLKYRNDDKVNRAIGENEKNRQIVKDIILIDDLDFIFGKRIVLCGESERARSMNEFLKHIRGLNVCAYCCLYPEMWKKEHRREKFDDTLSVLSLKDVISENEENTLFVLDIEDRQGKSMLAEIEESVPGNIAVVTWFTLFTSVFFHVEDERIDNNLRDWLVSRNKMAFMKQCMTLTYNYLTYLHEEQNPVLIFQCGKVGSLSIYNSLLSKKIKALHIHNISKFKDLTNDYFSEQIDKWIRSVHERNKIKVITVVRDPVAISVAWFFQKINLKNRIIQAKYKDNLENSIIEYARGDMTTGEGGYEFDWFDKEIKGTFGIDVYDHPFDREKGYTVIRNGNIELLILTLEKLNNNEAVIGDFMGIPNFGLKNTNIGDEKSYKFLYDKMKQKIRIPEEILDFYYKDNQWMKHFYSEEQIERFENKWRR